jgi:hypothetical protein
MARLGVLCKSSASGRSMRLAFQFLFDFLHKILDSLANHFAHDLLFVDASQLESFVEILG